MTTATRIGVGEYEYKGYEINKDECEANCWWVKEIGEFGNGNDHWTLRNAKKWIDDNPLKLNREIWR